MVSIANILSLVLQSDKKDFSAISRSVNIVFVMLKVLGENREINHLSKGDFLTTVVKSGIDRRNKRWI